MYQKQDTAMIMQINHKKGKAKKMKINTNILTSQNMEKELKSYGIKEPLKIMKKAIQIKTSILIPEIKATLHWIYNGNKEWSFSGDNSTNVDDYLFQLM